jgi:predicted glutamine amidotransferase
MCEIAVLSNQFAHKDSREVAIDVFENVMDALTTSNRDGLGVVAVKHDSTTESFEYATYKQADPDLGQSYRDWFDRHDDAWRYVLHARAATAGTQSYANAHPLSTGACDQCEFDHVLHNGVVSKHREARSDLKRDGHQFTTKVDSEVIAHTVGSLPDSMDDHEQTDLSGSLNYFLFAEDGILARTERKYRVTDNFSVVCTSRDWLADHDRATVDDDEQQDYKRGFVLVTPDGDEPSLSFKRREKRTRVTGNSSTRTGGWGGSAGWAGRIKNRFGWASRQSSDSESKSERSADDTDADTTEQATDNSGFTWLGDNSQDDDDAGVTRDSKWGSRDSDTATKPDVEDAYLVAYNNTRVHADPFSPTKTSQAHRVYQDAHSQDVPALQFCDEHFCYHASTCPVCLSESRSKYQPSQHSY